jgi:hypothetical protein
MRQAKYRQAPVRPVQGAPGDRFSILAEFYREEFLKHQRCLEEQREYYSDSAIESVEEALTRIISQLEYLSAREGADQVVSRLLRKFNVVTRLSSWSDPKNVH